MRDDGAILLETRPPRGLLGGLLGFPGTGWDGHGTDTPPVAAAWKEAGVARHGFTHFELALTVLVARVGGGAPCRGEFLPWEAFAPGDLPTVMRKVWDVASAALLPR